MKDSRVYSDFRHEIAWIKRAVKQNALTFPKPLGNSANYYLNERLKVLSNIRPSDPRLGRPLPYAVFWLALAFRYDNPKKVRELALTTVYDCLAVTIADDIVDLQIDGKSPLSALAEKCSIDRDELRRDLFSPSSNFWSVLARCEAEFMRYKEWNSIPRPSTDPLSDDYLEEASRYFVSVGLPALAGIAILAGDKDKLGEITLFVKSYSMGWRIVDDLLDWREDIQARNFNNSILLQLVRARYSGSITEEAVLSMFMEEDFASDVYGKILLLFKNAKLAAQSLNSVYLNEFIEDQIAYHRDQLVLLLDSKKSFQREVAGFLLRQYSRGQ